MLLALGLTVGTIGAAIAEEPPGTVTATASMFPGSKKPPPGFEAVQEGTPARERVDPSPLVVGAYAAFFVLMFGYIIYMARSQALLSKEMGELAERVRRAEKK
jgi:hypothetical protein